MSTITEHSTLLTLINVFTVTPDRQQELVDHLIEATDYTIRKLPGFVSANIHKSLDGVCVTNYAQWESKAAFEAFVRNPAASAHFKKAESIAERIDYHTYTVEHVAMGANEVSH